MSCVLSPHCVSIESFLPSLDKKNTVRSCTGMDPNGQKKICQFVSKSFLTEVRNDIGTK